MPADWSTPTNVSQYTTVLGLLRERDEDVATQFKNTTNLSNISTDTIRFDRVNNKWQNYTGTGWEDLIATSSNYNISVSHINGELASYYLNATNINSGTINDARLPNSITSNITGNLTGSIKNSSNLVVLSTGNNQDGTDATFTGNAATATLATTATNAKGIKNTNATPVQVLDSGSNTTGTDATFTGNAATATTLETGRTIAMTGDVVWTSASFDGSGNVTGSSSIQAGTVGNTELDNNAKIQISGLGVGTAASATTGEIRATNNITAYYSDDRLKIKTGNITNALDKTISLNGFKYVENNLANSFGYNSGDSFVGVSAQEVQKVLPEAVKLAPFDSDENNKSKSGENYLTVQYEKLVPLLVESIKELKDLIDIQSNRIQELEAKLGV